MKLTLSNTGSLDIELDLRHTHHTLELEVGELENRSKHEVLQVTVANGKKKARLHFVIGLNNRSQLVGEVVAIKDNRQCGKTVVAGWRSDGKVHGK